MPTPMKQCLEPGCKTLSLRSRCPQHERQQTKVHNDGRAYYKSLHWERLRAQCMARYGGLCAICDSDHLVAAHHVKPRLKNEPNPTAQDTLDNLIALCQKCHNEVEDEMRKGTNAEILIIIRAATKHA